MVGVVHPMANGHPSHSPAFQLLAKTGSAAKPGLADLRQPISRGVFAHSYKRWHPRLFFTRAAQACAGQTRHRYEQEMLHAFEALAAQTDRIVNPPGDNVVALGGTG